jgi:pimeloyl-ACP methyl ester carboxylesterase
MIPESRKLIYEDTGHMPMLERPGRFNADLRAFLDQTPVPSPALRASPRA